MKEQPLDKRQVGGSIPSLAILALSFNGQDSGL
jgi:hypothetical protein